MQRRFVSRCCADASPLHERLTKRGSDAGESAAIPSIFLRLNIFQLDGFAVPAPAQVTQTAGQLLNDSSMQI